MGGTGVGVGSVVGAGVGVAGAAQAVIQLARRQHDKKSASMRFIVVSFLELYNMSSCTVH